jgi:DNA modification methylase
VERECLNTIQKPIKLIERLVLASSNEGDFVLDPFSGVGTTAVVCQKHNRRFVGFEINEKYVRLTNERLQGGYDYASNSDETEEGFPDRQPTLFDL